MTPLTRFLIAAWLMVGSLVGSPAPCMAADTPVTLHGPVDMHRAAVRLSDLFIGVPAEADRDIAQAPPPGKQAVYDARVLSKLAARYDLDWQPQTVADHVVISTPSTRITSAALS